MSFIKEAKFIDARLSQDAHTPIFKREFRICGEVLSAVLEISALGVYEAHLNGIRIGDFVLAPGWTEYEKRIPYQSYDITDMLTENNVLTVGVGHGWYCSRVGFNNVYPLRNTPALIAALKISYADGREEIIKTDESWLAADSEIIESTIYGGEVCDARVTPDFSSFAVPIDFSTDLLYEFDGTPVRETERINPKRIITTPKGELVVDFGQNLTGYPEIRLSGKSGDTVKIYCAEILDKDGNFYNENYRSAKSRIEYTLGGGEAIYKPHYTFFGFRYLKIEGNFKPASENITAIVVHSDITRTGYFKCGHAKLNKLYENVIWGQRGNFLDVPTDCPQRDERLGWTGDAQVFCRTAFLNFDCKNFFKKWLRDMKLAQNDNGGIPRVIPDCITKNEKPTKEWPQRFSAAWSDAATICPYEHYMAYADKEFLGEMFDMMKSWVKYIETESTDFVWSDGWHYGDWLALDDPEDKRGKTNHNLIATAFFYHSTELVIKAGKILGEDVTHFEHTLPKIKKAFVREYFIDGKLTDDTQTAHVLAIHFGLIDKELLANRLIELIEERGDTLTTGFVGTPYLLDTLTEIGRADKAYTLLLQEKFPSWLFSVNMGATTIWEHWDGLRPDGSIWSKDMNSFNHYAYGSVAAWIYRTVCGIRYDENEPGYKHFVLAPIPDSRLGAAKAKLTTKHGDIVSEWVYESDGSVRYTFAIPKGTSATVKYGEREELLTEGRYTRYSL